MIIRRCWFTIVVTVLLAFGIISCASIVHGRQARVQIESLPTGASVWVDGLLRGKTPLDVTMTRDELHSIKFALDGHEELIIQTDKKISKKYIVANILLGVIWLAVDAISGAWYEPVPQPLRVLMSPKGERCASGDCPYLKAPGGGKK